MEAVAKGKTVSKRSAGGRSSGSFGPVVWLLRLIVIGLLAVIARYAYIAAQPDRTGYSLFGQEGALTPAKEYLGDAAARPVKHDKRPSLANAYSKSDRAKLNELVDQTLPAKR